jgi:hypothetical protein
MTLAPIQGCWLNSDGCSEARCSVLRKSRLVFGDSPHLDGLKFCCCSGDNCNDDISADDEPADDLDNRKLAVTGSKSAEAS